MNVYRRDEISIAPAAIRAAAFHSSVIQIKKCQRYSAEHELFVFNIEPARSTASRLAAQHSRMCPKLARTPPLSAGIR
jgi:hypothetical protein